MDGLFGPDDMISVYSDAQAIANGTFVDVSILGMELRFHGRLVNRMSRHLFRDLWPYVERNPTPVDALMKMLRTKLRTAEYIAGPEEGGWFYQLPSASRDDPIWLVQNEETGGWTVMYSSDY